MANGLICAVLVNFNGATDTEECVQSLLACSYPNLRILIVDNGSDHGKVHYGKAIPREQCEIIETGRNLGFAGANNVGIRRGLELDADYFLILNNDTVVEPNFIKPLLEVFRHNSSVGIVTGKIRYYDDRDYLWFGGSYYNDKLLECKIDGLGQPDNDKYSHSKEIPFATGCLWLIPRRVIETVGLMSEDYFLYYEDADYCERVKQAGLKIWYEPKSVIYHKESRSTKKGSPSYNYYNLRNYLIFLKKYHTLFERLVPECKRLIRSLKDALRGRSTWTNEIRAWQDFLTKKTGVARYY
ncbi:glycosyltransferase family 2 protein [Bifidobacterium avesanii]|uniref:Glycosyltransferase n=1 Tax=Bifidobacterium avesanii TaxID=1798157 RepID=A0A7K3TI46_9BIFI|nr:glycosyltransferase family 2 protein [Bifidobacterium avesanii]KAB8288232.1 glycosyl transferase [Bifidobacterium avesanii]NEG78732.1 glycosyltransferase [Bifidobacterium avesanii]